jgi:nitroimidazol reductase NimA-like FMN-containing flavoprotein (pyridoxamine 5'-phosphate oxidase superfamily)
MTEGENVAAAARKIIDANLYMVLGTADADGNPWASPVYFAPDDYRDFFWVSRPEARHSRNLSARDGQAIAIVIFDSSVPIGTGRGVYMSAVAREVPVEDSAEGLAVFSRRSLAHGGVAWTAKDVRPPAELCLFQATATEHYILGARDQRVRVTL